MKEENILICNVVVPGGVPSVKGSGLTNCYKCGTQCWISPSSMASLTPLNLKPICQECFGKLDPVKDNLQWGGVMPGQVEELLEALIESEDANDN